LQLLAAAAVAVIMAGDGAVEELAVIFLVL
jgi:hypothetical protein